MSKTSTSHVEKFDTNNLVRHRKTIKGVDGECGGGRVMVKVSRFWGERSEPLRERIQILNE